MKGYERMIDNVTNKEMMQKNVEEFSRLQSYMVLVLQN